MKKIVLSVIVLLGSFGVFAEGELDAIRYSGTDLNGTARGVSMGGAFGALGGDLTGININPAGLGVYRSSEISGSLSFSTANTKTDLQGDYAPKTALDNVAYVGYYPTFGNKLRAFNFGFSYSRLKSFDRNYQTEAPNSVSMIDFMAEILYGFYPNEIHYENLQAPWLGVLGCQTLIVEPISNSPKEIEYQSIFPVGKPESRLKVSENGVISSFDLSIGANFSDRFYLGATLSLADISYYMTSRYEEGLIGGGFSLENTLETQGNGFQLKLGAIFKPTDALRFGVSYHSPTWYSMTNYYSGWINANYRGVHEFSPTPDAPDNYTNYTLNTPSAWTFSAAGVLGGKAILSLDYEMKLFQEMFLARDFYEKDYYDHENTWIKDDFKIASTLRFGAEFRFTPQFSGRLGYAWMQNPYNNSFASNPTAYDDYSKQYQYKNLIVGTVPHFTVNGDTHYFTAGIGYKFTPQFYMDLAFLTRMQTDDLYYFPSYERDDVKILKSNAIELNNLTFKGLLTMGYKF